MGEPERDYELLRAKYQNYAPESFFLDAKDMPSLAEYLNSIHILEPDRKIESIEKPGEGNMNLVLRVKTDSQSFIIKQSRPWVEKYPDISAPAERAEMESLFYTMVQEDDVLHKFMPELIKKDTKSNILILQDLGQASDMSDLYSNRELNMEEANQLVRYLSQLHSRFNKIASDYYITNRDMRDLNYQHIFKIPFDKYNGLDLDSFSAGLRSVTDNLLKDEALLKKVREMGNLYFEDGNTLLHGDFYPGSWLRTKEKVYVIDPEFCFFGFKEFDVGVMIAHLVLSNQGSEVIGHILTHYKKQLPMDDMLMYSFAGIEMLRRIIGVAQLPLNISLKEKKVFMEMARELIISPDRSNLPC